MLYDPKWDKTETKADPFSLESLIAWLEKQPAEATYDYGDSRQCMAAQCLRSHGVDESRYVGLSGYALEDFFPGFRAIAIGDADIVSDGWTFGAALSRARAVLASRSVQ